MNRRRDAIDRAYTCCGAPAPNRALARDFDHEICPRTAPNATNTGRNCGPIRSTESSSSPATLLAAITCLNPRHFSKTHDISQKTDDRPNRPLVCLLAHRNPACAPLGYRRVMHGRRLRHSGFDRRRSIIGAVRSFEHCYPICLVRDLAELVKIPATDVVAHRTRACRQIVCGFFEHTGDYRHCGSSLYCLLRLYISRSKSRLMALNGLIAFLQEGHHS